MLWLSLRLSIGLRRGFSIFDADDSAAQVKDLMPGAKPDAVDDAKNLISRAKNAGLSPEQALAIARSTREMEAAKLYARYQARLASFMEATDSRFCLENDPALVVPVVAFVQDAMESVDLVDEGERIRVGVALEEAILNAMYRGNLELTSDQLRDAWQLEDGGQSYYDLLEERRRAPAYRDRRVHVAAAIRGGATLVHGVQMVEHVGQAKM